MSHRETDDDYDHVVARLGPKHRVIECKDDIQWILQERIAERWRSQKFLTSREGVLRYVAGLPGAETLTTLPERYASRSHPRTGSRDNAK